MPVIQVLLEQEPKKQIDMQDSCVDRWAMDDVNKYHNPT